MKPKRTFLIVRLLILRTHTHASTLNAIATEKGMSGTMSSR